LERLEKLPDHPEIFEKVLIVEPFVRSFLGAEGADLYMNLVTGVEDGTKRNRSVATLCMIWSCYDVDSAVSWAKNLPSGEMRDEVMNGFRMKAEGGREDQRLRDLLDSISEDEK
jgi:hypothetical protein